MLKDEGNGNQSYKARLLVKGYAQNKRIGYDKSFSPAIKMI